MKFSLLPWHYPCPVCSKSAGEPEVEPGLAGESVILWWGLFDTELYVEHQGERFGPHHPVDGPIPLHRYRAFKKSKADERADRIEQLARQLGLPIAALAGEQGVTLVTVDNASEPRKQPFAPAPAYCYPTPIAAKLAIADELARPLAKLPLEDRQFIDQILKETLERKIVLTRVRDYFRAKPTLGGEQEHAG